MPLPVHPTYYQAEPPLIMGQNSPYRLANSTEKGIQATIPDKVLAQ